MSWKVASPTANAQETLRDSQKVALRESQQQSRAFRSQLHLQEMLFSQVDGNIHVEVFDPHIVNEGGRDEHTEYRLRVRNSVKGLFGPTGVEQEWTKSFRYQEMYDLRAKLVDEHYYTDEEMPRIPEKNFGDRFTGALVEKRRYNFQVLLEWLVLRPPREIAPPVLLFLTAPTATVTPPEQTDDAQVEPKQRQPCDAQMVRCLVRDLEACTFSDERSELLDRKCSELGADLGIFARDAATILERCFRFPREKLAAAARMKRVLYDPHNDFLLEDQLQFPADRLAFAESE